MSLYNITEVILIVLCSIFIILGIKGIIQSNKYKKDTFTKDKIISYFKENGIDGIIPQDIPRDIMKTGFTTYMLKDQMLKYENDNNNFTIAEKALRRKYIISDYYNSCEVNNLTDDLLYITIFGEIVCNKLLNLEILWAMEMEFEDDYTFNEEDNHNFECFKSLATIYLKMSDVLYNEILLKQKEEEAEYQKKMQKPIVTKTSV